MEKLMKPAEYAKELGISRQAVYAKIKRGILTAKSVEGKLYIVVDSSEEESSVESTAPERTEPKVTESVEAPVMTEVKRDYESLLRAKDETITVLKGTVKDLKKSNKQISTTLKGEIDLLKDAFHEMRSLYILQLEQKKHEETEAIEIVSEEESVDVDEEVEQWVSLKKFFKLYGIIKEKQQEKVLKKLVKAYKAGDDRIIKENKKFKVNKSKTFEDMI
jgi:predicted site-specific integrase-resolvase